MSAVAPIIDSVPTIPLSQVNARQSGASHHPYAHAAVAAKNQKYVAPTQVCCSTVFSLAEPMAAMTRHRLVSLMIGREERIADLQQQLLAIRTELAALQGRDRQAPPAATGREEEQPVDMVSGTVPAG